MVEENKVGRLSDADASATALSSPSAIEPASQSRPSGLQSHGAGAWTVGPWMRDGISVTTYAPAGEPRRHIALTHPDISLSGAKSYARMIANARLIATAPDFAVACGADLHPGEADTCGPLAWLRSAVDALELPGVRQAVLDAEMSDDREAFNEMVDEVRALYQRLTAALSKARGEQ